MVLWSERTREVTYRVVILKNLRPTSSVFKQIYTLNYLKRKSLKDMENYDENTGEDYEVKS